MITVGEPMSFPYLNQNNSISQNEQSDYCEMFFCTTHYYFDLFRVIASILP
jgi:hypothetical protein